MRNVCCLLIVPIILTCLGGCGKQKRVTVHPVTGQVLYAGRPAIGVHVYFSPTDAPAVPVIPSNPRGITGPDGRYTLTTFVDGDGAAEGAYQVILIWPAEKKSETGETTPDRLLGWYGGIHSKLTAKVQAGDNAIPTFYLTSVSAPPEELNGIPGKN